VSEGNVPAPVSIGGGAFAADALFEDLIFERVYTEGNECVDSIAHDYIAEVGEGRNRGWGRLSSRPREEEEVGDGW
jgi:hypothetical protein